MDKNELFSESIANSLDGMFDKIEAAPILKLNTLDKDKSALIIVDMVNGFVKEGSLYSKRVEAIEGAAAELSECFDTMNIPVVAFCDSHEENSIEFNYFPKHCIKDSNESKITDEIAKTGFIQIINKSTTNGYYEEEFQRWLLNNPLIDTFVIVGCCTDICVLQTALSLKTHFNLVGRSSRIIVPANLVETYDAENHDGDLCNLWALNNMMLNGIEVVSDYE